MNEARIFEVRIMKKFNSVISLMISLCLGVSVIAQSGGTFSITQSVVASGGGQASGGTFNVTGTTGQALAGTLSNGAPFNVRGGFWQNSASSNVSVSGRVLTIGGRGVRNAMVNLIDPISGTQQVLTGPLGAYRFNNVVPGRTYTISIMSRRFLFTPQMVSVPDALTGIDFIASP